MSFPWIVFSQSDHGVIIPLLSLLLVAAIWVTDKISNQRRSCTWPQKSDPQKCQIINRTLLTSVGALYAKLFTISPYLYLVLMTLGMPCRCRSKTIFQNINANSAHSKRWIVREQCQMRNTTLQIQLNANLFFIVLVLKILPRRIV